MQTYAILRRSGWRTPEDLEAAAMRSRRVGDDQMSDDVRWSLTSSVSKEDSNLIRVHPA